MKKILYAIIVLCFAVRLFAQQTACPDIIATVGGAPTTSVCPGSCVSLTATPVSGAQTTNYTVGQIPYTPYPYGQGTPVLINIDDTWSGVLNIGFNFCFYGNTYNQLIIGSNGLISFNLGPAGGYCQWPINAAFPSAANPTNVITCPFHDVDPSIAGTIQYATYGVAPCRVFVVSFNQCAMFSCTQLIATQQIAIYETTNIIETYIQNKPSCPTWNGGAAIHGIQNAAGTVATVVPGRNFPGTWTAQNDAWRFTPSGPLNFTVNWLQNGQVVGNGTSLTVCPTEPTTYTSQGIYQNCDGTTVTVTDDVLINIDSLTIPPIPDAALCNGDSVQLDATIATPNNLVFNNTTATPIVPGQTTNIPINVAGLVPPTFQPGNLISVCVNITQNITGHLNLYLISPSGQQIDLSISSGGFTNSGYNNVCFVPSGFPSIATLGFGAIPANSTFIPEQAGGFNPLVGANNNGTWTLRIIHSQAAGGQQGTFNSVVLNFANLNTISYQWTPAAGLSCANCPNPVASPATSTVYQVIATSGLGCTDTAEVVVQVGALPAPVISCGQPTGTSVTFVWPPVVGAATYEVSINGGTPINVGTDTFFVQTGLQVGECADISVTSIEPVGGFCGNSQPTTFTCCTQSCPVITPVISGPNNLCAGATITLTGPAGFTNYTWSDGSTAQTLAVNGAGTYCLTVADANGCTGTACLTVIAGGPVPTITGNLGICPQTTTTLTAQPGFSAYLWSNGATSTSISVNSPGAFSVTVSDGIGCTGSASVVVTQFLPPAPTISGSTTICAGVPTTLDAGAGYAAYIWAPNGETNSGITTATAGTYSVTVTDANGCTGSTSVSVSVAPNLTLSITANGPTTFCDGGAVTLNAGLFDNYLWSNNSVTPSIVVAASGTYSVQVTNNNGCTGSANIQVVVNPNPTVSLNAPEVCLGGTANLSAVPSGGTAPYAFAWTNGLPNAPLHVLSPTSTTIYDLTLTDGNGCTTSATTVFTVNPNPVANAGADQTLCNGVPTTLQASATGGTAPFTYGWSGGLPANATPAVTVFDSVTYQVTVTDANGCTATDTVAINMASALSVTAGADQTICLNNPATLGAVQTGGAGPYTFVWTGGFTGPNPTVSPAATTTFTVTVTDAVGCTATDAVTVDVVPSLLPLITTPNPSFCFNTTIPLNATPGFVSYQWSTLANTANINVSNSGAYSVTVTDATGCSGSATITVTELQPVVVLGFADSVSCAGYNDGSVTITGITGGIGSAAAYVWNIPGETGPIADTLPAGTYTVTVTDGVGCTGSASYFIGEPGTPVGVSITAADATCAGLANGVAIANPFGGTPPYDFVWNNFVFNDTVTGLLPDVPYFVTVTDQNGCSISDSIMVDDPAPLVLAVTAVQGTNCYNGADGSATIIASGGAPGYVYQWGNGETTATATQLTAGTTSILIGDALGCTATATVTITEPTPVGFNVVSVVSPNCNGTNSGSAQVTGTGGTAPYTYAWDAATGFQGSPLASNLPAGTYGVTVTDFNGCLGSGTVNVPFTQGLQVELDQTVINLCFGDSIATIVSQVTGGAPGFEYLWSTGDSVSTMLDSLPAGTYGLTITDIAGCTASDSIVVEDPEELVVTVVADSVNCNGGSDGALLLTATGGRLPYVYSIDSLVWQTGSVFPGLEADSFTVYVRDNFACIDTATVEIFEPDSFLVEVTPLIDTIEYSGSVDIVATANHPATWAWANDTTLSCNDCFNPTATPTGTTVYTLMATDSNGCSVEIPVVVVVLFPRRVYVANLFTPNNDGANDVFLVQGGVGVSEVRSFRVFDRWGEMVHESLGVLPNDVTGGWDGTFKNKAMNPGVFVWFAEIEYTDGFVETIKGDVTLLR